MTFRYPLNGVIYPGAMVGAPSLLTLLMIYLSCRPDVVWWFFLPPALLTAAMALVSYFYYPAGISVGSDVVTIHYLFGNRLSFPAAAVEWSFPTGRLVKGVAAWRATRRRRRSSSERSYSPRHGSRRAMRWFPHLGDVRPQTTESRLFRYQYMHIRDAQSLSAVLGALGVIGAGPGAGAGAAGLAPVMQFAPKIIEVTEQLARRAA